VDLIAFVIPAKHMHHEIHSKPQRDLALSLELGLAPLLGIHTFIEDRPGFAPATLGRSDLGGAAVVANVPALSPQDVHAEQVRRHD